MADGEAVRRNGSGPCAGPASLLVAAVAGAAGGASVAWAQPPSAAPAPATSAPAAADPAETPRQNKPAPPTRVSGVTVTLSREVPRVVGTFPAAGSTIAPGVLVLRVTYDTAMFPDSWSYVTSRAGGYPDCADAPRRLVDKKTFALICRTMPNTAYAVWLNREPYDNFVGLGRRAAAPYLLKFRTSGADPVWTLADAMKLDPGLPPGSNPAEPEGKKRPGETVDTSASDPPPGTVPGDGLPGEAPPDATSPPKSR